MLQAEPNHPTMLFFDGYCPECRLHAQEVRMFKNDQLFWECPQSRLQVAIEPPHATILRWRGSGRHLDPDHAILSYAPLPLVLAEAQKEAGMDTMPDTDNEIVNEQALEWYLHEIFDTVEELKAHQFDATNPLFEIQRERLIAVSDAQWQILAASFESFCQSGITINILQDRGFLNFKHLLESNGIIFVFDWQHWHRGWEKLRNPRFNFQRSSLLELSMFLSAIFLSEPYDPGSVEFYFNDKTLERILKAMVAKGIAAPA